MTILKQEDNESNKVLKRFELKLDPRVLATLNQFRTDIGAASDAEAMRKAIKIANFYSQAIEERAKIYVIDNKTGEKRELIFI